MTAKFAFGAALLVAAVFSSQAFAADACSMLTQGDVSRAFGESFGPAQANPFGPVATPPGAAKVTVCRYEAANPATGAVKSVQLLARLGPADPSVRPAGAMSTMVQMGYQPQPVPGVGDAAYWGMRSAGPFETGQMNVFKNAGRIDLIINITGGTNSPSTLQSVTAAALTALSKTN